MKICAESILGRSLSIFNKFTSRFKKKTSTVVHVFKKRR